MPETRALFLQDIGGTTLRFNSALFCVFNRSWTEQFPPLCAEAARINISRPGQDPFYYTVCGDIAQDISSLQLILGMEHRLFD